MSQPLSTEGACRMALSLSFAVTALTLGAGCVPEYHPPTPEEPHAIVKIRRTYDAGGGTSLHERLLVDDHSAYDNTVPAAVAATAHIDSTLVWPTQAQYAFTSAFFHVEVRQVFETYYEQVSSQESESYSCGTSMCSRMVTRYHSEPRQRWVTKPVEVSDGSCNASTRFSAMTNHVYLLQYSYQDANTCTLSCFEQVPQSDGTFENRPCLVAALPPQ